MPAPGAPIPEPSTRPKRSAPSSPTTSQKARGYGNVSGLPVRTKAPQDIRARGAGSSNRPEAHRSPSALSLASSSRSRKTKVRRLDESLLDEQPLGEQEFVSGAEDFEEDLVSLPISDELLSTRMRSERMRQAASASTTSLASSLVFGMQRTKSAAALTALDPVADNSEGREKQRQSMEQSLGYAIPGSVAYASNGMLSASLADLSRSSSSQSSTGQATSPITPPVETGLAPPLPVHILTKSDRTMPSSRQSQRAVTAPMPRQVSGEGTETVADKRQRAVSTTTRSREARPRAVSSSSRSALSSNLTSRRPKTPVPKVPQTPRSVPVRKRDFSTDTADPEQTPPWEAAAPPLLYRGGPDERPTTATPEEPRKWDDVIVPSVTRRLLQEQFEASDALITDYDNQGRPIKVAHTVTPIVLEKAAASPMSEKFATGLSEQAPAEPTPPIRARESVRRTEIWQAALNDPTPQIEVEGHGSGCCEGCTVM